MNLKRLVTLLFICCLPLIWPFDAAQSEILVYEFDDPALEKRFNQLSQELRCPKCQNNNLADSNAPLAVDLKDIIAEKLKSGQSDEQIIAFLTARYGDFINYRPPVKPSTWLIWFGPFVFLLSGAGAIFWFVGKRRSPVTNRAEPSMNEDQQAILNSWQQEVHSDEAITSNQNEKRPANPEHSKDSF